MPAASAAAKRGSPARRKSRTTRGFAPLTGLDATHDLARSDGPEARDRVGPAASATVARSSRSSSAHSAQSREVRVDARALVEREVPFEMVSQTVAHVSVCHVTLPPRCALT